MDAKYRIRLAIAAVIPFIAGAGIAAGLTTPASPVAIVTPVITRPALTAPAAPAVILDAYRISPGARALDWAEIHETGYPYVWGGTGPWGYDCSGAVYEAVSQAAGIWLPRTTYDMLGSWHLIRTYTPQRGDLAFYGSGHVEFVTAWWHTTFGAQQSGTRVGWHEWNGWWAPTAFYRIVR